MRRSREDLDPNELKFDDCATCKSVFSKRNCKGCEAGEFFVPADEPIGVDEFMGRYT